MTDEIVVAISQSNQLPWIEIRNTQQETWIAKFDKHAQIIHYKSIDPPTLLKWIDEFMEKYRFSRKLARVTSILNRLISRFVSSKIPKYEFDRNENELLVHSFSTYFLFGRRNLALYDWFITHTNAKFLFQTNTSSYVDVVKLKSITKELDCKNLILAGAIINPYSQNFKIVSGAGRLLSRELIVDILNHKSELKFNNLEDICLSELTSHLSATVLPLERFDLPSLIKLNETSDLDLSKYFHFRCKSEAISRTDSKIMFALHQRLRSL